MANVIALREGSFKRSMGHDSFPLMNGIKSLIERVHTIVWVLLSFCLMLVKTVTVFLSIGGYSNRVPS
jgi:hypothetical protein